MNVFFPFKKIIKTLALNVEPVTLKQRYIYILPTRFGWIFLLILVTMLVLSANYHNNLGYALTFLLGSMALISILHTFRNICGLTLSPAKAEPVFAGNMAWYGLYISDPDFRDRRALQVRAPGGIQSFDVQSNALQCIYVPAVLSNRGLHPLGRFTLSTCYPLGLVRAWSKFNAQMTCLAYPEPDPKPVQLSSFQANGPLSEQGHDKSIGVEEFAGLKAYQPGDSYKRIDWKAFSREMGLWSKEFQGGGHEILFLDWNDLGNLGVEPRLSRLCRLVLEAERNNFQYGLHLPGKSIAPDRGREHQHKCLQALALY